MTTGRIGTDLPKQPGSDVRCDVRPMLDVRHIRRGVMDLPGTVPVCSVPGRSMQHDAHLREIHRTSLFVTIATGRIGTDLPRQPGSDVRCCVLIAGDGIQFWMCVVVRRGYAWISQVLCRFALYLGDRCNTTHICAHHIEHRSCNNDRYAPVDIK